MDDNRDPMIIKHLEGLIAELTRKLDYPKNSWQRKEQLTAQLAEAQQRLAAVARNGRQRSSFSRERRSVRDFRDREGNVKRPFKPSSDISYL